MLRNTLGNVVEMVREEARLSTNTSRSIDHTAHLTRLIKRHHQTLADDWDWEHLKIRREDAGKELAAGQRYYDFPVTLNTDRPFLVWHHDGAAFTMLPNGITPSDYDRYNSDDNTRHDGPERWDWYGHEQFEIWPLPASASGEVRFEGHKKIETLSQNDSRLVIDDIVVSLYVAAELLTENKNKEAAAIKLSLANSRLIKLKAAKSDGSRIVMGMGGRTGMRVKSAHAWPRHPKYIG